MSLSAVLDYFSSLGAKITNGFAYFKNLLAETLTVGTSEKPTGITLYDEATGEPYCLKVVNGQTQTVAGACANVETPFPSDAQGSPSADGSGGDDPPAGGEPLTDSDTEAPVITLLGNNPAEISIGSTYGDLGATVADNVDDNLGYKVSVDGGPERYPNEILIDTSVAGEHTIIYKATDNTGNIGTAERIVRVVDPNAAVAESELTEGPTATTTEPSIPN